jgi:tRNA pseudouridine13 synthase
MYVHAYQSYIWNAIVSERIRTWGCETPIVGDLVYDVDPDVSVEESSREPLDDEMDEDVSEAIVVDISSPTSTSQSRSSQKRSRKPWVAPRVKRLTEGDLDKYTVFDVIMPLPGKDVVYPGGKLGEKYMEFLRLDGLDPNYFERKQK